MYMYLLPPAPGGQKTYRIFTPTEQTGKDDAAQLQRVAAVWFLALQIAAALARA
jgi:hypothetical protein